MRFVVEKRGQHFHVVNESTGERRGTFTVEGEAKVQCQRLQSQHDEGIRMASGRMTPPRPDVSGEE
jgi:hypothetical protein